MPRETPIPFIPAQAQVFAVDQTSARMAALLGSAGSLAATGFAIGADAQNRENVKRAALAKLRQLGDEEALQLQATGLTNQIRESNRQEQSAEQDRRIFEKSIREIEEAERLGAYGTVNNLSADQLRTANARGLGFTSPEAVVSVDRAIGERQANLDFPRLLEAVALDDSRLPSEHLAPYLKGRQLGSSDAQAAYSATLTERLAAYQRGAVIDRAKKARGTIAQNAVDRFQFQLVNGFETLDKQQFQNDLSALFRGLKRANPDMNETEFKGVAVAALEPLFVGPEARFTARDGLSKLGDLLSAQEIEQFGLGGVAARLRDRAADESRLLTEAAVKGYETILKGSQTHERLREVRGAILRDVAAQSLPAAHANALLAQVDEELGKPDISDEFKAFLSGNRTVGLTKAHDGLIEQTVNEAVALGTVGSDMASRGVYMLQSFGRTTEAFDEQLLGLVQQADLPRLDEASRLAATAQAVTTLDALYAAAPGWVRTRVESGAIPAKVAAIQSIASMSGQNAARAIDKFGPVPSARFEAAAAILDDPAARKQIAKLDRLADSYRDFLDPTALPGEPVYPSLELEQRYRQALVAVAALATETVGTEADQEETWRLARTNAKKMMKQSVKGVKLGGAWYMLTPERESQLFLDTAGGREAVGALYRDFRKELRETYGTIESVRLAFDRAQQRGDVLAVPVIVNDLLLFDVYGETETVFEIPLNLTTLKEKAKGKSSAVRDVPPFDFGRAFSATGGFSP